MLTRSASTTVVNVAEITLDKSRQLNLRDKMILLTFTTVTLDIGYGIPTPANLLHEAVVSLRAAS